MRAVATAAEAVARLDAEVARMRGDCERPVLAFSGGLASLLVAALARKRGDLRCVVVGFRGSADLEAALVAQKFLDYPVTVLRPTAHRAWQSARAIHRAEPGLSLLDVLALVPLTLVEDRHPEAQVLSGFGLTARTSALRGALQRRRAVHPGLRLRFSRTARTSLVRMAEAVGLPESFLRAAPRTPSEGSGVGPSLRAMAHARRTSLPRLLAGDGPSPDYHERPVTRVVSPSSGVDWRL